MSEVGKLIRDLSNNDEYVRLSAARMIGNKKYAEAVDSLIPLLVDPNVAVRTVVADTLGKIGDVSATPALIECLDDEYSRMRKTAVEALGELGDYRALTSMIKVAQNDSDREVRAIALKAVDRLNEIVQEILDKLEEELNSNDESDRKQAVKFLGSIGSIESVKILLKAHGDSSWAVKNSASSAIEQLLSIGPAPFMEGLKSSNSKVRTSSAEYLGRIKNPVAVNDLINVLRDKEIDVVRASAKSLGEMKDNRALFPLRNLLRNTDNKTKEIILESISRIGGEKGVEIMLNILLKDRDFARDIAEEKLFYMGKEALLPMAFLLEEMEEKDKNSAIRILTRHGSTAVDYFIEQLNSPEIKIKKASIVALGYTRATEALQEVSRFFDFEDKDIRDAAKTAVKNIKKRKKRRFGPGFIFSSSIIDRLSTFFSSTIKETARALGSMGKPSEEEKKFICEQCGRVITRKTSIMVAGLDFGKCPECKRILCKNCAMMSLVAEGRTSISCPKCGRELEEVF